MRTILITLAAMLTVTPDTGLAIRMDPSTITPMEAIKLAQVAAPGGGGNGRKSWPGMAPNPCVDPCSWCYDGDEVCPTLDPSCADPCSDCYEGDEVCHNIPGTAPNPCADPCGWCYEGDEVCPTSL